MSLENVGAVEALLGGSARPRTKSAYHGTLVMGQGMSVLVILPSEALLVVLTCHDGTFLGPFSLMRCGQRPFSRPSPSGSDEGLECDSCCCQGKSRRTEPLHARWIESLRTEQWIRIGSRSLDQSRVCDQGVSETNNKATWMTRRGRQAGRGEVKLWKRRSEIVFRVAGKKYLERACKVLWVISGLVAGCILLWSIVAEGCWASGQWEDRPGEPEGT
ncbi:hypothetical protein KCU88_g160, partial [Aureobasidium melanogenum]